MMISTAMAIAVSVTMQVAPADQYGAESFNPQEFSTSAEIEYSQMAPGYDYESFPMTTMPDYQDQLQPYDYQAPWHHGYFQEIPAYGGFNAFRPYNYKHVLSQSQAAGGWGMPPAMPYSQQFWHRHQQQAAMQRQVKNLQASEYASELARLRARHDFELERSMVLEQRAAQRFSMAEPTASRQVNQTNHTEEARIEKLRRQIEQQNTQLRALQQTMQQRRLKRSAPPRGSSLQAPALR